MIYLTEKTVLVFLSIFALMANSGAVYTHMLCSIDAGQIIEVHSVAGQRTGPDHPHGCSHTAHHEPVDGHSENDQCTPCVNDFYDFTDRFLLTDRVSVPCMLAIVSDVRFLPCIPADNHPQYKASPELLSTFRPQYPPLKTVLLS